MTPAPVAHPQQSAESPGEDALAVATALAILHARIHHQAEMERRSMEAEHRAEKYERTA